MDTQKVDLFIMSNGKYFPEDKVAIIREKLLSMDETKWNILSALRFKNPTVISILSIFLGCYGIDRFYLGNIGLGIGKLITCGGCGIWAIVDRFLIMNAAREINYAKLSSFL